VIRAVAHLAPGSKSHAFNTNRIGEIMSGRLTGKVAIITGAASGQGAAAVDLFAAEGAKVAAFDVNEAGLKALTVDDSQLLRVVSDLTSSDAVQEGIRAVIDRFGTIDVLYNNAGAVTQRPGSEWDPTQDGLVADLTEEVFDLNIAINLKSQFLMCKYSLPHMIAGGGGSIINVSSLGGPFIGTVSHGYCIAKAGVVGLTKAIANSYGTHGVRCNAIAPGVIETPLVEYLLKNDEYTSAYLSGHPMHRFGQAGEMAAVGLFLASDDSTYVSGAVLPADGAWTARAK
jgi:NAD(P)-dependent dehydrogenase (short-subunit alcohol dehydrogenase family)